ncbi:MAG: hypothetical protein HQL10_00515 [Nitrospirae bacterium]|nr:hypothetical protein [Nitrospirota bacterium]
MKTIRINEALVLLFENIQAVLGESANILGKDQISEKQRREMISCFLKLQENLDKVKDCISSIEIAASAKPDLPNDVITYGKN